MRPLSRRLAAYAVDVLILAAVLILVAFLAQSLIGYQLETGDGVWPASLAMISLPSWAYFVLFDASSSGATPGKRLLGLRVAAFVGSRRGAGSAFVRTAIKLVPWELTPATMFALSLEIGAFSGYQIALLWAGHAILAVYLFVALRNDGERSLHDLVVGSAVRRRTA